MLTVEVLATRADAPDVAVRVKVQPSVKVKPHGAYFETNEHYPAPDNDGLRALIAILQERWEASQLYAHKIADHILRWADIGRDDK